MTKLKLNRNNPRNGGLIRAVPPRQAAKVKQYTIREAFYYLLQLLRG